MSKVSKEEKLKKVIAEVEARRKRVFDELDAAALEAAKETIKAMKFEGCDTESIQSQKIRLDAADKVLERAGFGRRTFELTGPQGSPLVINITESRANEITKAAQL